MSKRVKYTVEEKFQTIKEYHAGLGTLREISEKYKIDKVHLQYGYISLRDMVLKD